MLLSDAARASRLDDHSRELAHTLDRAVRIRTNETELREDANPVIERALSELYGISDLLFTAERRSGSRTGRTYDKAYGGVVVEWEWRMDASRRRHGARQAVEYLCDMRAEVGDQDAFTAVVCDGARWGFLALDPCGQMDLFQRVPSDPVRLFEWHPNSPASCRRFIELVASNRSTPLSASALSAAFGPGSSEARRLIPILAEVLGGRSQNDRTDTLFKEWRRVLDVVYGDLDVLSGELIETVRTSFDIRVDRPIGEMLFALHTYFALLARVMALEVLAVSANDFGSRPTNWPPLQDIELIRRLEALDRGELPSNLEVQNLFEGDVFSWFVDACRGNVDLLNGIRDLLSTMAEFAFPRAAFAANPATDVLRDLYQVLVPRPLRRALGEFLTPAWLAEACLQRLARVDAHLESGRVLDPTCGTGTFLIPVLRQRLQQLRASKGNHVSLEDVQVVLDSVVGFDINPIAVTATRVNYLIALGDLATLGPISLPVWRTDSVLIPDAPARQGTLDDGRLAGREWKEVLTSLPFSFPIPPALAVGNRMALLRKLIENSMVESDSDLALSMFVEDLQRTFGPRGTSPIANGSWEDTKEVAVELHGRIRRLADEGRNGVWARIIENAFAPVFFGKADVVIGNPPWLTWTRLPEEWRRKAEPLWRKYGLWRVPLEAGERRASLASTDLATLVFATALDRYLHEGGTIGLLTPDSLLSGDPGGRAFRKFRLVDEETHVDSADRVNVHFRVLHVDDWSQIGPFQPDASNRPVFIAARRGEKNVFPVSMSRWVRKRRGQRIPAHWSEAREHLSEMKGHANPVNRAITTSAWSWQAEDAPTLVEGGENSWNFGKGLDTRGANGVFFVQILEADLPGERLLIRNLPREGRNPSIEETRGWVEAPLVRPLLRGRDVAPWESSPNSYIFAPYNPDDLEFLGDERFRDEYPAGWRWLRRHRRTLATRRTPPTRSWNMSADDWCRLDGPLHYMAAENIVVVRELQRRPAAALVEARFDENLGRTCMPLIDHKLTFCAVASRDEALYLSAFINSASLQDLLASYGNQIAMSPQTLRRLPIPSFERIEGTVGLAAAAGARMAGAKNDEEIDRIASALLARERQPRTIVPETPFLRVIQRDEAQPYERHVPLLSLDVAAGVFLANQPIEELGWVEAAGTHLAEGMFAATVRGRSMEPRIPDNSIALFRSEVGGGQLSGSYDGRIVLAQLHDAEDPEGGGRYTVKRLRGYQEVNEDGVWENVRITLESLNPEIEDITLDASTGDSLSVIAEFIRVLGTS